MANPEHLKILKQGVEVWNKWREENPDNYNELGEPENPPDLTDATFTRADFRGANFAWANFSNSELY